MIKKSINYVQQKIINQKFERSLAHEVYLLLNFQIFFTFKQDIADNDIPITKVQILDIAA